MTHTSKLFLSCLIVSALPGCSLFRDRPAQMHPITVDLPILPAAVRNSAVVDGSRVEAADKAPLFELYGPEVDQGPAGAVEVKHMKRGHTVLLSVDADAPYTLKVLQADGDTHCFEGPSGHMDAVYSPKIGQAVVFVQPVSAMHSMHATVAYGRPNRHMTFATACQP